MLLTPIVVVSATSTDLAAPDPDPGTEVVNIAQCLGSGLEVPFAVDECGDTMTGDLGFTPGDGVAFPAGRLTGDGQLAFAGQAVCRANVVISGCAGGDITGVIAGSGLLGGGLSGDVTLNADTSVLQARVTGSCIAGQSIRAISSIGSVTCETDDNSGGTVTSVASGAGLTGGPITTSGTLSIATGGVSTAMLANNAVTGAKIDPATTITASGFVYNTPETGRVFADPVLCQRGVSGGDPHADMQVYNLPGNVYTGIALTSAAAAGNYKFYCPVPLPHPPGATVTVTAATLGHGDFATGCLVGAELHTRTIWFGGVGTLVSTVYSGSSSSDYLSAAGSPVPKAFPAFTAFTVGEDQQVWVTAIIDRTTTGGTDCRYLGAKVDYTIDRA
ncbi:MAG TPA: hypothetical protein VGR28_00595 [Candidatus Thermoplasmatota archaeon]|nr:hypothetical protein [Candidatus Thermoplasmatota archaeon]